MYEKTIAFIKDLYGNQEFTPLAVPVFVGNEKKYLNECIDTTFVSSVGKFVDRFENDMAVYAGAKRAVVCVSGALPIILSIVAHRIFIGNNVYTMFGVWISCMLVAYVAVKFINKRTPWLWDIRKFRSQN